MAAMHDIVSRSFVGAPPGCVGSIGEMNATAPAKEEGEFATVHPPFQYKLVPGVFVKDL